MSSDLNMRLWKVVPELRSRGVSAQLAAWYPWLSLEGTPATASCGIFVVMDNCCVTTTFGSDVFNERHPQLRTLEAFDKEKGPGKTLQTYLPKTQDHFVKLNDTLNPPTTKGNGKGKDEAVPAVAGEGEGEGNGKKGKGRAT